MISSRTRAQKFCKLSRIQEKTRFVQKRRFIYFVNEQLPGTIIELSEMSGFKGEYFEAIAEAAMHWDGSDPIRR